MSLKKYDRFIKENISEFNFQDLFLKLTEYTVPAGYEDTLENILRKYVPNLKRDNIGNYYTSIGDSKTLFTSHLDTYSKKRKKINHVIDGNMIKTDGTSVLGGDNKNGVVILLYLISQGIPGTYFFFIGEESIVNGTGCYGSTTALKENPEFFTQFDKAIAFDRRGKGSFVRRQGGRNCASDEFADAVIEGFAKSGLEFGKDNAYRTDSAIFMDVIPEITNISSGGEYEHTFIEATDIQYVEEVAKAASKIDWDNLPIVRTPSPIPKDIAEEIEKTEELSEQSRITFEKVNRLMGAKGFICLNKDDFQPGVIMVFDKYLEEKPVKLIIKGDFIKCIDGYRRIAKFREGTYREFKDKQKLKVKNLSRGIWMEISKKMDENGNLSNEELNNILINFDVSYDEFKNYMENEEEDKGYIKFFDDHIVMDIRLMHQGAIKRQEEQEKILSDKENERIKNKDIEEILDILKNYSIVENINSTRLLKYIDNNKHQFTERFISLDVFDNESGTFRGFKTADILRFLIIKGRNPDIIYDRKWGVFYEKN
jgi:hypothetical protein